MGCLVERREEPGREGLFVSVGVQRSTEFRYRRTLSTDGDFEILIGDKSSEHEQGASPYRRRSYIFY